MIRALALLLALAAPAAAESREECEAKFNAHAVATGFVVQFGIRAAKPVVVVNERMWNAVDFATKQGVARTFSCAVAGPGRVLVGVEFRSNMTDKVLARWTGTRLISE